MKYRIFGFIAALAVVAIVRPVFAQVQVRTNTSSSVTVTTSSTFESSGEYIKNYGIDSEIRTNGIVGITERIRYEFPVAKHGIMRSIPYIKTNSDGKKYRMTIDTISVKDETGAAYPFTSSDDGSVLTIKIGDPNRTITGEYLYLISYDVRGALTYFPDHDELYWNDTGSRWPVAIVYSRSTVSLPSGVNDAEIRADCFTGTAGSAEKNCKSVTKNHIVSVETTKPLAAYEGLTAVIGFPKNIVTVLNPVEVVPFFSTKEGKIALIFLIIVSIFWYVVLPFVVVWKWWTGGRDPKPAMGEVKAWFSPPKTQAGRELTPAETGSLIDETVDMRDIYGTIIDLARRGYIKIIESAKGKFTLKKVKMWDDTAILPFEKVLLQGIFGSSDSVALADADLSVTIHAVSDLIYISLVSDGFFPKNPKTIRTLYSLLAVFSFVTINPILFLVSLTFGLHMPRKTVFGSGQAAVARSLKNFLVSQDKQLAFQAKNQMMFEKLLPYAVAFGVEEIWAARFKDLAMAKPTWYESSSRSYSSVIFARSIGQGYSRSFAYSASYKSTSGFSSGFSSGGGFSGGGGGGGGGGSW